MFFSLHIPFFFNKNRLLQLQISNLLFINEQYIENIFLICVLLQNYCMGKTYYSLFKVLPTFNYYKSPRVPVH